jgi:hypothetical protein
VETLKDAMPILARHIAEGKAYTAIGPGGTQAGLMKNEEFVVRARELDDGSLVQPTSMGIQSLRRML